MEKLSKENSISKKTVVMEEYNVLRIIAILLVVIGHSYFLKSHGYNLTNIISSDLFVYKMVYNVVNPWIYSFHMPLFMILSGALFSIATKKYTLKEYVINRARRLLIPFFFCELLYAVPIKFLTGYYGDDNLIIAYIKSIVLLITPAHLWFLFVLFIISVFSFWGIEKFKNGSKLLIIMLLLMYLVHDSLPQVFQMYQIANYWIYFYIGFVFEYKLYRKKLNKELDKLFKLKSIVIFLFTFILVTLYDLYFQYSGMIIKNIFMLVQSLIGCVFIYMISYKLTRVKNITKLNLYKVFKKYNFQIYLYHEPLEFLLPFILYSVGCLNYFNSNIGYVVLIVIRVIFPIIISIGLAIIVNIIKNGFNFDILAKK